MSASRTVRRIAATALAAGSVVALVAMPASADSDHGRGHGRHQSYTSVVLGDIQYDSPGRDDWSNRSLNRSGSRSPTPAAARSTFADGRSGTGRATCTVSATCAWRAVPRSVSTPGAAMTPAGTSTRTAGTTSGATTPTRPRCATTMAAPWTPTPGATADDPTPPLMFLIRRATTHTGGGTLYVGAGPLGWPRADHDCVRRRQTRSSLVPGAVARPLRLDVRRSYGLLTEGLNNQVSRAGAHG